MITNRYGAKTMLRDALSDAIADNLPRGDIENTIDSFCKSKEYQTLLDEAMKVVKSHLEAGLKDLTNQL